MVSPRLEMMNEIEVHCMIVSSVHTPLVQAGRRFRAS